MDESLAIYTRDIIYHNAPQVPENFSTSVTLVRKIPTGRYNSYQAFESGNASSHDNPPSTTIEHIHGAQYISTEEEKTAGQGRAGKRKEIHPVATKEWASKI